MYSEHIAQNHTRKPRKDVHKQGLTFSLSDDLIRDFMNTCQQLKTDKNAIVENYLRSWLLANNHGYMIRELETEIAEKTLQLSQLKAEQQTELEVIRLFIDKRLQDYNKVDGCRFNLASTQAVKVIMTLLKDRYNIESRDALCRIEERVKQVIKYPDNQKRFAEAFKEVSAEIEKRPLDEAKAKS